MNKKDESLCKNAVRSAIRKAFTRSEHYKEFVNLHRIEWYAGKRKRVSYECAACKEKVSGSDINVDHIIPIGRGVYRNIGDALHFYNLVFCDYSNLQILCKSCHKSKTALERKNPVFDNALF